MTIAKLHKIVQITLATIIAAYLAGCAGSPYATRNMSDKEFADSINAYETERLCEAYAKIVSGECKRTKEAWTPGYCNKAKNAIEISLEMRGTPHACRDSLLSNLGVAPKNDSQNTNKTTETAIGPTGETKTAHAITTIRNEDIVINNDTTGANAKSNKPSTRDHKEEKPVRQKVIDPHTEKWARVAINKPKASFDTFFPNEISYEKGKYETTKQFNKRTSIHWLGGKLYFDVEKEAGWGGTSATFDYDADAEILTIFFPLQLETSDRSTKEIQPDSFSSFIYKGSHLGGMQYFFSVNSEGRIFRTYTASNALGAKITVKVGETKTDEVRLSNINHFEESTNVPFVIRNTRENSPGQYFEKGYEESIHVPISEIRKTEPNIALRIEVKHPNSTFYYHRTEYTNKPNFDHPQEVTEIERKLRTELTRLILYNKKTKEIYAHYKL